MKLRSRAITAMLVAGCLLASSRLFADEETNYIASLETRFSPAKPTVELSYGTAYRFLFLQLLQIADVTVQATEGIWQRRSGGEPVPAVFIKCRIVPSGEEAGGKRRRLSVRRIITTVLTMPELDTLVYCKEADEYVNPLFRKPKITKYFEIYDLEDGTLRFFRHDYLSGESTTNLIGGFDLARQGKEIPAMLKMMAREYYGEEPPLTPESDFRIYVNIDGMVTPFVVTTEMEEAPSAIVGGPMKALACEARPAPEAEGRGRPASVWAASLPDVARHLEETDLIAAAEKAPKWSMVPLVADYALAIGYVRAWLTGARLSELDWPSQ